MARKRLLQNRFHTIVLAPTKSVENPPNISFGTNGVNWVHLLWKIQMQVDPCNSGPEQAPRHDFRTGVAMAMKSAENPPNMSATTHQICYNKQMVNIIWNDDEASDVEIYSWLEAARGLLHWGMWPRAVLIILMLGWRTCLWICACLSKSNQLVKILSRNLVQGSKIFFFAHVGFL